MVRVTESSRTKSDLRFLNTLSTEQLVGLAAELHNFRSHPPLTRRSDGKYEGDILGFVKGLRLSARVIYFLRERLSQTDLEVSWGHIVDKNEQSCSPECDIIIHQKGHIRKWNGNGGGTPIMEFKFVEAGKVKAVISCKSELTNIDKAYPGSLRKFGVKNVFLFAECCAKRRIAALRRNARKHGYKGVWVLYYLDDNPAYYQVDDGMHQDFGARILRTIVRN